MLLACRTKTNVLFIVPGRTTITGSMIGHLFVNYNYCYDGISWIPLGYLRVCKRGYWKSMGITGFRIDRTHAHLWINHLRPSFPRNYGSTPILCAMAESLGID